MNDAQGGEPYQDTERLSDDQKSDQSQADHFFELWDQKTELWIQQGIREGHARDLAQLELKIDQWPSKWGDDLIVFIFGDLNEPTSEIDFPELGITIEPGKVTNSIATAALCVMKARVKIREKSVAEIINAAARINTLLSVISAVNWGNVGIGWWSHITHGSISGTIANLEPNRSRKVIEFLANLPEDVTRKVRSALYWIREPRQLIREGYRSDTLRLYAGYWNAFECLVEAVCLLRPQAKLGPAEKQTDPLPISVPSVVRESGGI